MSKLSPDLFEDFLCAKTDMVENPIEAAIAAMVQFPEDFVSSVGIEVPEHDAAVTCPIMDDIEEMLKARGFYPCRPYYGGDDGETPCFMLCDEDDCKHPNCPFREEVD